MYGKVNITGLGVVDIEEILLMKGNSCIPKNDRG